MEFTNGEIYLSRGAIQTLTQMRLPVKVSLQVVKVATKLSEQFQIVDAVRNHLVDTYGSKNKVGGSEVITPNDPQGRPISPEYHKFITEVNELMAQKTEIDIQKIILPSEIDGKPLMIEPSILIVLEKFVEVK